MILAGAVLMSLRPHQIGTHDRLTATKQALAAPTAMNSSPDLSERCGPRWNVNVGDYDVVDVRHEEQVTAARAAGPTAARRGRRVRRVLARKPGSMRCASGAAGRAASTN